MSEMIYGLSTDDLLAVKRKLDMLGIGLGDLIEFLDRDKVQLFGELKSENRVLRSRLKGIADRAAL